MQKSNSTLHTTPSSGYLRQPQVLAIVPISSTTLWRWCSKSLFPKPVKLSSRVTAWREEDVQAWLKKAGEASQ